MGAGGEWGAGAGRLRGAHRPPKPGRAAGRGGAIRRPGASGRVEPQAQCSSWAAGTQRVAGGAGIVCSSEGRAGGEGQSGAGRAAGRPQRIKERIAGIYQELQALPEKIRGAGERIKAWEKEREREWVHGGGFEKARAERAAELGFEPQRCEKLL